MLLIFGKLKNKYLSEKESVSYEKKKNDALQKAYIQEKEHGIRVDDYLEQEKLKVSKVEDEYSKEKDCRISVEGQLEEEQTKHNLIQKELLKEKQEVVTTQEQLDQEQETNRSLKKGLRKSEDQVVHLEEQVAHYENKRVALSAELRHEKDRVMALEDDMVQVQQKVVAITKKLSAEEEKGRIENEKSFQLTKELHLSNVALNNLQISYIKEQESNQIQQDQLQKENRHKHDAIEELTQEKEIIQIQHKKLTEDHDHLNLLILQESTQAEEQINNLNSKKKQLEEEVGEAHAITNTLETNVSQALDQNELLVEALEEMEETILQVHSTKDSLVLEVTAQQEFVAQMQDEKSEIELQLSKVTETLYEKSQQYVLMQTTNEKQQMEYTEIKELYDTTVVELEYFVHETSKRLEKTNSNLSLIVDDHVSLSRRMVDFNRFSSVGATRGRNGLHAQHHDPQDGIKLLESNNTTRSSTIEFDEEIDSDTRQNRNNLMLKNMIERCSDDKEGSRDTSMPITISDKMSGDSDITYIDEAQCSGISQSVSDDKTLDLYSS